MGQIRALAFLKRSAETYAGPAHLFSLAAANLRSRVDAAHRADIRWQVRRNRQPQHELYRAGADMANQQADSGSNGSTVGMQRNDKSALPAVHGISGSEGFADFQIDARHQALAALQVTRARLGLN